MPLARGPCSTPHSDCWRGVGRTPLLPRHDQLLDRRIPDQRYGQSNCTVQVFWGTTNFRPFYAILHRTYDQFVTSTNTQPTHPPKPQPHPTKIQPHTLTTTNPPPINLPVQLHDQLFIQVNNQYIKRRILNAIAY